MIDQEALGRTIQLFLVDGTVNGLTIATLHGWTGSIIVARNQTLPSLLKRMEAKRTGVYVLSGPDPENNLKMRVYVGEADSIIERLPTSAGERGFWDLVAIITTSDESLTKAHVRYLEAELISIADNAGRASLDNTQKPVTEKRYLPEADKANMQGFLKNIAVVLPVVGFDFLKPITKAKPATTAEPSAPLSIENSVEFVIEHRSGIKARMIETEESYFVLKDSLAAKDSDHVTNTYGSLRESLIEQNKLTIAGNFYKFAEDVPFKSPSAAAAVVLDRNSNGRTEWKVSGTKMTYDAWQNLNAVKQLNP